MRFEVREVARLARNGTKWHGWHGRQSGKAEGEKEVAFLNAMFYYCDI
ncbi:MAG: hypothetical protein RSB14_01595 [Kiritimatiellia bacterium]